MAASVLLALLGGCGLVASTAMQPDLELRCDVLIAGGSTAALSAALTATIAAKHLHVCLTEPTDELGGQLAYNPAIDYGTAPSQPSVEWASMTGNVTSEHSPCWVSKSCYAPATLGKWVAGRLAALPNLHVLLRTTVRAATRDATSGKVLSLTLVTRTPTVPADEWSLRLSDALPDWYSPEASAAFLKTVRTINASVIIEATELGDVLA